MNPITFLLGLLLICAGPVAADSLRVATDTPPIHSLVARIMKGVGTPYMVIDPGASPHSYALKPSQAAALAQADIVFWIGPELTPWLRRSITILTPDAVAVPLMHAQGTTLLSPRHGAGFGASNRADHALDPHVWLDPANAVVWLNVIAAELAKADPGNAARYWQNAADGRAELKALSAKITTLLAGRADAPFVVYHDAYHYFEARFGVQALAAVALGDAGKPGPFRVAEIRDIIKARGAKCVFVEPQFPPGIAATLTEGTGATVRVLDPIGAELIPGIDLYPTLLRRMAVALAACE